MHNKALLSDKHSAPLHSKFAAELGANPPPTPVPQTTLPNLIHKQ